MYLSLIYMDNKINLILKYLPKQIYQKKLEYLKGSLNYRSFLNKLIKELKNDNRSIISELDCAYRLKQVGFNVTFMPETYKQGEIIPGFNSNKTYDQIKKPDLWIYRDGVWIFIEVKHIKFGKTSLFWGEGEKSNTEKEKIIKNIIEKLKECIEQTKCFKYGMAYIDCRKGIVDLEKLEKDVDKIFKENQQLYGLILNYNNLFDKKISNGGSQKSCKVLPKTKVILNKYFKK